MKFGTRIPGGDNLKLLVLGLGARIRAGGMSRRYDFRGDPLGHPVAWEETPKPILNIRSTRPRLPEVAGTTSLDQLELLLSIPRLKPTQYVSLVRACNFYQDALWLAESEPNLAWLMFVSALETAANEFNSSKGSAEQRLRESKPDLVTILEDANIPDLVVQVADILVDTLGATSKFINFTINFLPLEPAIRPAQWLRLKWSKGQFKKILNIVYKYRSRSLHAGLPFPKPMFDPPFMEADAIPSEIPMIGLAASSRGGTWIPKDAPINLHSFHYVVRKVLLEWWKSMAQNDETTIKPVAQASVAVPVKTNLQRKSEPVVATKPIQKASAEHRKVTRKQTPSKPKKS